MIATPPANVFETVSRELTERACPGCGSHVDLEAYGVLGPGSPVVCRSCGNPFRLCEYIRV